MEGFKAYLDMTRVMYEDRGAASLFSETAPWRILANTCQCAAKYDNRIANAPSQKPHRRILLLAVSARDMSLSLGQSESYINKIENRCTLPSFTGFIYICEFFGLIRVFNKEKAFEEIYRTGTFHISNSNA